LKKKYIPILFFGVLLAVLAIVLQVFEYRYYIGSLDTDIYTTVVAAIFTILGIWIGINLLKKKAPQIEGTSKIDHSKIKELELNEREYEVLKLISEGMSNQEIADKLFLALPTIKTHTSNLFTKLNVRSRTQAIHKAKNLRLIL